MSSPTIPRTPKFLADLIENGGKPERAGFLGLFRSEPKIWVAADRLWAFTLLLIVAHQGSVLTYAFPVLVTLVGFWLYFKSPEHYVGFMWWQWFLGPEVRRLADSARAASRRPASSRSRRVVVTMIFSHHRGAAFSRAGGAARLADPADLSGPRLRVPHWRDVQRADGRDL